MVKELIHFSYRKEAMKKVFTCLGALFIFLILFTNVVVYAVSFIWTEVQPAGATTKAWNALALSTDGTNMIVGVYGGRLYLSLNSGNSWNQTQPKGNTNGNWASAAISNNGEKMLAGEEGGRLYLSTNSGSNWSELQLAGNVDGEWDGIAMSSTGQYMIASNGPGRVYVSTNSGSSWSEVQPAGNTDKNWVTVAISSDGQTILAGVYGGRLYRSTDGGSNWSETQPGGNANYSWFAVNISNNQYVIACAWNGRVYTSSNSGSTWGETQPAGNTTAAWTGCGVTSDGQTMYAQVHSGRVYISTNGGSSWSETRPEGNSSYAWNKGTMTSSGVVLAGIWDGKLFASFDPSTITPTPTLTPTPTQTSTANVNSSSSDPCPGFVTCPNVSSSVSSTQVISGNGEAEKSGGIVIQSRPGTMDLSVKIDSPSISSLLSGVISVPVPWSQGYNSASDVLNFTATSAFNGYPVPVLDRPATVMMHYDPKKLYGRSHKDLRLARYNSDKKKWEILPTNTVVKPEENLVANTTFLTGYYTVVYPAQNGVITPVLGTKTSVKVKKKITITPIPIKKSLRK